MLVIGSSDGWLARGECEDGERVDVGRHQVADGCVDELVTAQAGQAGKPLRHDQYREVPASVGRTGVTDVAGAVVHDLDALRFEPGEPLSQPFDARRAQGSTRTNGFTSYDSNTPSAT